MGRKHHVWTACFTAGLGLATFMTSMAFAKEGPGGVAPVDEQTFPTPIPVLPEPAISESEYASSQNLVFTIFGGKARKIFSYYSDLKTFDFNRPYAPDHKIDVVRYEGLKCIRRQARYGEEKVRCNFLFHPASGNTITVGDYTYTLEPSFDANGLEKFVLRLKKSTDLNSKVLIDESCPRYADPFISQGHLSCAYFNETDDFDAFFFPEDLHPQGVAVGWGVVKPGTDPQN